MAPNATGKAPTGLPEGQNAPVNNAALEARVEVLTERLEEQGQLVETQQQQISDLMEMNKKLLDKLGNQSAGTVAAVDDPLAGFEDGPCDPVLYVSPIAELRFSVSVGPKTKDSAGIVKDPIPEVFEFHGNQMTLNTTKRIFLAETYGPFPGNKYRLKVEFFRANPGQRVKPTNEVQYTQGPVTSNSLTGQARQNQ